MQVIEGNALAKMCDYSFGDHLSVWDPDLVGTFDPANLSNYKFIKTLQDFKGSVMTLFIDNIRLYNRTLTFIGPQAELDRDFIDYLMRHNDLLKLCKLYPNNKFIIFTSHEDTALDDTIEIPDNVLAIYAVNGDSSNPKVHPFPIGLQRKRNANDNRLEIMKERLLGRMPELPKDPTKLLYINCGVERNPERAPLAKFETNNWCTTRFDRNSMFFGYDRYNEFLSELQDHKFVVCPKGQQRGNTVCYDTHRIWETLYMRRVPVIKKNNYFRRLLWGFPVLWADEWEELTPKRLEFRNDLYEQAQTMDMSKLDLEVLYKNAINIT